MLYYINTCPLCEVFYDLVMVLCSLLTLLKNAKNSLKHADTYFFLGVHRPFVFVDMFTVSFQRLYQPITVFLVLCVVIAFFTYLYGEHMVGFSPSSWHTFSIYHIYHFCNCCLFIGRSHDRKRYLKEKKTRLVFGIQSYYHV